MIVFIAMPINGHMESVFITKPKLNKKSGYFLDLDNLYGYIVVRGVTEPESHMNHGLSIVLLISHT